MEILREKDHTSIRHPSVLPHPLTTNIQYPPTDKSAFEGDVDLVPYAR